MGWKGTSVGSHTAALDSLNLTRSGTGTVERTRPDGGGPQVQNLNVSEIRTLRKILELSSAGEPVYGQVVADLAHVKRGNIYAMLNAFVQWGWIKGEFEQQNPYAGAPRKIYQFTTKGLAEAPASIAWATGENPQVIHEQAEKARKIISGRGTG